MTARDPALQALIDKQAITDTLHTYCRGMDRADPDILASAYWPDGYEEHTETFSGTIADFVKWSTDLVKPWRTSHRLSNIMIDLDDSTHARAESYVWAYHSIPADNGACEDLVIGVRYAKQPTARDAVLFGNLEVTGRKDRQDPLYAHLPLV